MEIDGSSLLKVGMAAGVGGALVYAGMKASNQVLQAELCDEAKELEHTTVLLKDATFAQHSELSDRERSVALHHLEGVHSRLRDFRAKNKPKVREQAEKVDGVLTKWVAKPIGNVVGWLFGSTKEKKDEEKPEEVEIKTPQDPEDDS